MNTNTIYTQPNMIYAPNGEPCDTNMKSFHEQARILGHYPKVGLFVEDSSDEEGISPSKSSQPEPRSRSSASRNPSPSLMSRTLDARASAASPGHARRRSTTVNQHQASPSTQSQPLIPIYRSSQGTTSDGEAPPSSSASSASDSESDYGSNHLKARKARTASSRARTVKSRVRDAPYSKASSPTQAIVATAFRPPVSSGSSSSTYSSASGSNPVSLSGSDTPEDGKPYYVTHDSKTGKIKYICRTCPDYTTHALGDLSRHFEALVHAKPSHLCVEECGQAFTRKDAVIRHMKTKHPKWKIDYDECSKRAVWRKGATRPTF